MCTVINNVFVLCVIRYYQVVQQHFLNYITMLSQNISSIHISDTSISDFWSYSLLFLYVFIEKKKAVKWTGFLTTTGFLCQQQTEKTKRWKGERNGGEKEEAPLNGATGKVINSCRWRDNNHWESVHFKLKVFRIDTYIDAIVSSTFFFFLICRCENKAIQLCKY